MTDTETQFDREDALRWTWRGKLLHTIARWLRIPASIGMYPIGKSRTETVNPSVYRDSSTIL